MQIEIKNSMIQALIKYLETWSINPLVSVIGLLVTVIICMCIIVFNKHVRSTTGYTAGLFWLLTLYVGATWLAVGALSSMQFRSDVKAEYNQDVDKALVILVDVESREKDHHSNILMLNSELTQLKARADKFFLILADTKAELVGLAGLVGLLLEQATDTGAWFSICKDLTVDNGQKYDSCSKRSSLIGRYVVHQEFLTRFNAEIVKKEDLIRKTQSEFAVARVRFWPEALKAAALQEGLGDLKTRLQFMRDWEFSPMLSMPNQVLTLILAIAMGILGSTITMTWTFLKNEDPPSLRWYLMRPLVGGVSALVIFVFAKAGQMALTADGGDADLDPFFLSFVGIVAGLLSDQAYTQMENVGRNFLGRVDVQPERWATTLSSAFEKLDEGAKEQFLRAVDLSAEEMKKIVDREIKLPYQAQRRMADLLKVPLFELFSDTKEA